MESTKKILRRYIPSDPHLWIAFVAAAAFLLMELLHWLDWLHLEVPSNGVLIVIMIFILTLVADRLKEGDQVRENTKKLGRIAHSIFDKRVALRHRPSTQEEYDYLWGGYTGFYYVYNPSYQVDKNVGEEEIMKILLHRYQDPHFDRARYLFLTKDDSGQNDLKIFRRLMARVKQEYPDVVKKIEVRELNNKDASSAAEMYLGKRHGEPMGVLELRPALDPQHGVPRYYLVIQDEEVLKYYYQDYFEPAWNDKNTKEVENFWE